MVPLHPPYANADGVWPELSGVLRLSAAAHGQRHNRDTHMTVPEDLIHWSCLWVSDKHIVRPSPVRYFKANNPRVVRLGGCRFEATLRTGLTPGHYEAVFGQRGFTSSASHRVTAVGRPEEPNN